MSNTRERNYNNSSEPVSNTRERNYNNSSEPVSNTRERNYNNSSEPVSNTRERNYNNSSEPVSNTRERNYNNSSEPVSNTRERNYNNSSEPVSNTRERNYNNSSEPVSNTSAKKDSYSHKSNIRVKKDDYFSKTLRHTSTKKDGGSRETISNMRTREDRYSILKDESDEERYSPPVVNTSIVDQEEYLPTPISGWPTQNLERDSEAMSSFSHIACLEKSQHSVVPSSFSGTKPNSTYVQYSGSSVSPRQSEHSYRHLNHNSSYNDRSQDRSCCSNKDKLSDLQEDTLSSLVHGDGHYCDKNVAFCSHKSSSDSSNMRQSLSPPKKKSTYFPRDGPKSTIDKSRSSHSPYWENPLSSLSISKIESSTSIDKSLSGHSSIDKSLSGHSSIDKSLSGHSSIDKSLSGHSSSKKSSSHSSTDKSSPSHSSFKETSSSSHSKSKKSSSSSYSRSKDEKPLDKCSTSKDKSLSNETVVCSHNNRYSSDNLDYPDRLDADQICTNSTDSHDRSHDDSLENLTSSRSSIKENIHYKQSPHRMECPITNYIESISKIRCSKTSSSLKSKSEFSSSSPNHERSKLNNNFEDPTIDLWTNAPHNKTKSLSPSHESTILKQASLMSKQISMFNSSTHSLSPNRTSDSKNKSLLTGCRRSSSRDEIIIGDVMKHTINEGSDSLKDIPEMKSDKKKDKYVLQDKMSFDDFMTFDETTLGRRRKTIAKSYSGTSLSSSSQSDQVNADNASTSSKSSLSLIDLPSSSRSNLKVLRFSKEVRFTEEDLQPESQVLVSCQLSTDSRSKAEISSRQETTAPDIIGAKSLNRTQVYSGKRHGIKEVKSLHDLCMRVLMDNIDAIMTISGMQYNILKPVLERCTAQQLFQVENYNPHFLHDTDELWEILCLRDFRECKPRDKESWRDMYTRLLQERELKYHKLKQSMSSSIIKGQAGRKSQLAFMDTVAKPPREILRKQKKFGTGSSMTTKTYSDNVGHGTRFKNFETDTSVSESNLEDDPIGFQKPLPPMMIKSLEMRKNMRW